MQSILGLLEMQHLVGMQVVCKKWQAVICSIGYNKKRLGLANSNYDVDYLKKRSFRQIDLNTFTRIKIKPYSSKHLPSQLVNLFPNIESIAMHLPLSNILTVLHRLDQLTTLSITFGGFPPSNEYAKLLRFLNSCVSIIRLDICALIPFPMSILRPILARLEQFSYLSYEPSLVKHFGPNCSRVSFNVFYEWHTINGQWLANVTHLDLKSVGELDPLIEYLSEHALALQVLHLEGQNPTRITSQLIGHLSKLMNLSEIDLSLIFVDSLQLEEAIRKFQLIPLVSIRTFTLSNSVDNCHDTNRYTSVLCTILPSVEHLTITGYKFAGFEKYLDRFTKLRSHSFN